MANETVPAFLEKMIEDNEPKSPAPLPDIDDPHGSTWGEPDELVNSPHEGEPPPGFIRASVIPRRRWIHLVPASEEVVCVPRSLLDSLQSALESVYAPEVRFGPDFADMRQQAEEARKEAYEDALETLDEIDECMAILPDTPRRSR